MKLLPRKATEDMDEAGLDDPNADYCDRCYQQGHVRNSGHPSMIYRAMYDAAPTEATNALVELVRAVERLRCQHTGNPCGTDTWPVGLECPCPSCQAWLARVRFHETTNGALKEREDATE